MPRWEADGKQRLELAALELFTEIGYDGTTVAEISRRAGLTERSFYRYFTDKREVLFSGAEVLTGHLVAAIHSAPEELDAPDVLVAALSTADRVFLERDLVRRRAEAIGRNPALAERELIKLVQLAGALIVALVARGTPERTARLLTDLGLSAFRIASEDWIATGGAFVDLLASALEETRGHASALGRPRSTARTGDVAVPGRP